ncbi:acyl-CoA thioesterase [Micrococcales bacterium 31B]|nr:acyl-CoA thioesterase [Micrococcales bacterium 31B]
MGAAAGGVGASGGESEYGGEAASGATGASEKSAEKGGERVRLNVPVRWFDLDAYGHVNNSEMFRLLEEARIKAFWTVPGQTARAAKNITIGGAGSETITLIAGHRIEYRTPLDYRPQGVEIDLWVTKLGGASAELAYEVFSDDDGPRVVYAVATSVMVFVSATTERPRKLTDAEREAWGELLGPPPKFRN